MIKIAITKGRIEKQVCKMLAEAGFDMDPIFNKDRELLIETKDGISMIFGKPNDVVTFLEHGIVDIGFVGKDTLDDVDFEDYYELLDFIFYPGYDLKELSYNEIEIIRMMIAYLNNKADEFIKKYENHPDEYLDKYKIKKTNETSKRIYYNLIVDDVIVGNGWITKKEYRLKKKGMDIFIEPQYRRKKYGTKFYQLLACEISGMDIAWIYLIVDKEDKIAISFLNKQINKYEKRIIKGNKIIFEDTLIVD